MSSWVWNFVELKDLFLFYVGFSYTFNNYYPASLHIFFYFREIFLTQVALCLLVIEGCQHTKLYVAGGWMWYTLLLFYRLYALLLQVALDTVLEPFFICFHYDKKESIVLCLCYWYAVQGPNKRSSTRFMLLIHSVRT